MEKLQKILELACYEFGLRTLPDMMRKRDWECPESVELSKWTELLKSEGIVKFESKGKSLNELLQSITAIRHTAVHRLRTNSAGLERFLADAEDFTGVLGDTVYSRAISQLRSNAQLALTELTKNKQFIQLQLEKAQEEIAKQRAELDQKEQKALHRIREEDERCRTVVGERLKDDLGLMGDFKAIANSDEMTGNGIDIVKATADYDDHCYEDSDDTDDFEDCNE